MRTLVLILLFAISSLSSGCATSMLGDAFPLNDEEIITESIYSVDQLQSKNYCNPYQNSRCTSYYLPKKITPQDDEGNYFRLEVRKDHDGLRLFLKNNSKTINIQEFEIVEESRNRFSFAANFTSDEPLDTIVRKLCFDVDNKHFSPSGCGIKSNPNVNNAYYKTFGNLRIKQATKEEITNDLDDVDISNNILVKYKYTRWRSTNYNGVIIGVLLPVTLVIDIIFWPASAFHIFGSINGR